MRLSINWLKDFVDLMATPADLADRLTLAGLEVEAVEDCQPDFQGVLVGQVTNLEPHPQADRLRIATVTDGRESYQVVCGAPNVKIGGLYPFAPVGATLAHGQTIKAAKLRGVLSAGMLLAEDELGLSEDHSGLMELDPGLEPGVDLAVALHLADVVLEVAITPNRADCLSVLGLAREVSALYSLPLRQPQLVLHEDAEPARKWGEVVIEAPDDCPRYAARLMFDLEVRPSPFWLRRRLQLCGVRSINNLVDVTNYVLMEFGQPLHAFDFEHLSAGRIVVRHPAPEETTFITLDGQERALSPEMLLICDGREPVAIGGVMGGLHSEVTPQTRRVLLESAYFNPISIRRTSKRLGLCTEASYRFERGVDPQGMIDALERASQLMVELGGGRILQGRIDVYPRPISRPRLSLRPERVNAVLGTSFSRDQIAGTLTRLHMPPLGEQGTALEVQVPAHRGDLTREIDLIEEMARLQGYDTIPVTLPRVNAAARRPDKEARCRDRARDILQGQGFTEVINYSFQPERWTTALWRELDTSWSLVRLANPLSEDQAVLRLDLLPGLLETLRKNLSYLTRDVKIFEIAKVFSPLPGQEQPREWTMLAGLMSGARQTPAWNVPLAEIDIFDLKGTVENLLDGLLVWDVDYLPTTEISYLMHAAQIRAHGEPLGVFGKLSPEIQARFDLKAPAWIFALDFSPLAQAAKDVPVFTPLPRYPAVYRDVAMVLPAGVTHAEVQDALFTLGGPWLVEASLFDVYEGEHIALEQRSLAYHLCYRDPERTLTDTEVNESHLALIQGLEEKLGAKLRT